MAQNDYFRCRSYSGVQKGLHKLGLAAEGGGPIWLLSLLREGAAGSTTPAATAGRADWAWIEFGADWVWTEFKTRTSKFENSNCENSKPSKFENLNNRKLAKSETWRRFSKMQKLGNSKTRIQNSNTWKCEHSKTCKFEYLKTRKLENWRTRRLGHFRFRVAQCGYFMGRSQFWLFHR